MMTLSVIWMIKIGTNEDKIKYFKTKSKVLEYTMKREIKNYEIDESTAKIFKGVEDGVNREEEKAEKKKFLEKK